MLAICVARSLLIDEHDAAQPPSVRNPRAGPVVAITNPIPSNAVREQRRIGELDEIASAVRFLLADESAYVTGTELNVDGRSL